MPAHKIEIAKRFWTHVKKTSSCWHWTGAFFQNGYGQFSIEHAKPRYAHRISYEMKNGPVPEGKIINITCGNRDCVNPKHLRAIGRGELNRERGEK